MGACPFCGGFEGLCGVGQLFIDLLNIADVLRQRRTDQIGSSNPYEFSYCAGQFFEPAFDLFQAVSVRLIDLSHFLC